MPKKTRWPEKTDVVSLYSNPAGLEIHILVSFLTQLGAEVGVSNSDQVLHALLHGALTQLSHTVLGDDHVGQVTGHGHDGAGIQDGGDPGDGALLSRGDLAQHSAAAAGVVGTVA